MPDVRAVLGVPYATARRFARPTRVAFDGEPDRYRAFGPAAPQPPPAGLVPESPVGPTDEHACLTLNVWTPARDGSDTDRGGPKPVLVWFHGGSFTTGSSSQRCFDGTRLATEHDVVVVSANYRLGVLGFCDLRPLGGGAANLGLLDAIAALEWVRDHVAALGGDPRRITIFGESAGGGLCAHLLASPRTRGLFAGAIVQSGITDFTLDTERAAEVARVLCETAGVDDLDALAALPVEALTDAQQAASATLIRSIGMMPFHPCVDGDIVPARLPDAVGSGTAAGVALVAGTTSDEMALYTDFDAPPFAPAHLLRRVQKYLGVDADTAAAIVAAYERETDDVWRALWSDVAMVVPMQRVLEAHAPHGPTYAYLFTWEAPGLGAAHAVDVPFTFGNFVDGWDTFVGHDDDAERVSAELRGAWARFAHTGDPGWPPYPATRIFGRASSVSPQHPFARRLAARAG